LKKPEFFAALLFQQTASGLPAPFSHCTAFLERLAFTLEKQRTGKRNFLVGEQGGGVRAIPLPAWALDFQAPFGFVPLDTRASCATHKVCHPTCG
jgi:hypothetical protein